MKFGIFLPPFHPPGQDSALAYQRDLELIEWLDELGYDEAYMGEQWTAERGTKLRERGGIGVALATEEYFQRQQSKTQH